MSRPLHRLAAAVAVVLAAGVLPAFSTTNAGAAPDDTMFSPAPSVQPTGARVRISPDRFTAVKVDLGQVRSALGSAPRVGSGSAVTFRVPTPTGGTERFAVQRTQRMQPKLAAAHPEISTYAGRSLDQAGTTIAMDVTPMGFHASVRGPQGQRAWYVDPAYNKLGTTTHLSYYGGNVPRAENTFVERETRDIKTAVAQRSTGDSTAPGGLVKQRIFRLALTSDPAYAEYFAPGADDTTSNSVVLAEKVTLINRVNQIYNDDMAINLQLVNDEDKLNLNTDAKATGADGPCGAHPCFDPPSGDPDENSPDHVFGQLDFCGVGTLGRNRVVLGQLIGADNYDIGHIGLGVNGGGVAYLGVVGWDYKGGGCTGLPQPEGDFFAIDYVAHEMGHQFGGNHTFNGVQYACAGGNRNGSTSVEPGSGSSVMAYAGICLQDDLQPHTDPYFSQRTIDEVSTYTGNETLPVVEVQTVSLRGFDTDGDKISLRYGNGGGAPVVLTRGTDYNRAGIEAAVEQLTGKDVTIAGWSYDPFGSYTDYPATLTDPDDTGFQVIFAGDPAPDTTDSDFQNVDSLQVTSTTPGVDGFVGETAKGGVADNEGSQVVTTTNHAPKVKAPANKTIPMQTPFTLTGSGTDPDGDHLSYLWEQNDVGGARGTKLVRNKKLNGPLFRVFGTFADVSDSGTLQSPSPGENITSGSASRTFPDMAQILSGNTNAKDGTCPDVPKLPADLGNYEPVKMKALNCFSEFLPKKGYVGTAGTPVKNAAMHFRLTARDGYADGGGTSYDDVVLRISQTAGPFLVTSQAKKKDGPVKGGKRTLVTWKVNGTKSLAKSVRILLSTDGGKTWNRVLAKHTANDGKQAVRIPHGKTSKARIKIEAIGNYFFDTNDRNFRIK
jgi:hypothetical protein